MDLTAWFACYLTALALAMAQLSILAALGVIPA